MYSTCRTEKLLLLITGLWLLLAMRSYAETPTGQNGPVSGSANANTPQEPAEQDDGPQTNPPPEKTSSDSKIQPAKQKLVDKKNGNNVGENELERAIEKATVKKYDLRYHFQKGEDIRWKVVHLVTVETRIQGTTQTAKTRSLSTKHWKIVSVKDDGAATLGHMVDDVNMWQQVSGRKEIKYDSTKDTTPPAAYAKAAESVGIVLSTITINPYGKVLDRVDSKKHPGFGGGQITFPLPGKSIAEGEKWSHRYEIPVRLSNGRSKRLQTRQLYQLESVIRGIATISMKTQVLTPIDDPKLKVQLVQRLSEGTVKFDLEQGRIISQKFNFDETVLAFNGANSSMKYLAKFTEELLPKTIETAKK